MRTLDPAATEAINDAIRTSSTVGNAYPSAIIEWNFNNCVKSAGTNLYNAGDDPYSFGNDPRMYVVDSKNNVKYPNTRDGIRRRDVAVLSASAIARPWREPLNVTVPIATNTNAVPMTNSSDLTVLPMTDDGHAVWTTTKSGRNKNFFASDAETMNVDAPSFTSSAAGDYSQLIGMLTNTPAASAGAAGIVTLFIDAHRVQDYTGYDVRLERNTIAMQSNQSVAMTVEGTYNIINSGTSYWSDVLADTAIAGQTTLKFNKYRAGSLRPGMKLTIGSGWPTGPSTTIPYITVTSVHVSGDYVVVGISHKVYSQIPRGTDIKTEYNFINIPTINTPDITTEQSLKQISGLNGRVWLVPPTSSEAALHAAIAGLSGVGGTVRLKSNITLTKPIVLPPGVGLDLGQYTITVDNTNFGDFDYAIYTNHPYSPLSSCTGAGNTNQVVIPTANDSGLIHPGRKIVIRYEKQISSGGPLTITQTTYESAVVQSKSSSGGNTTIVTDTTINNAYTGVLFLDRSVDTYTGNISIVNGTWALGDRGLIHASTVSRLRISNTVINSSLDGECILLSGCDNVEISNTLLTATNTGIMLEPHRVRNRYDACYKVRIKNVQLTAPTGIASRINAGTEMSNHKNIAVQNCTLTCSSRALSLSNCTDTFVSGNSFVTGGVFYSALNARSERHKITNNTFNTTSTDIAMFAEEGSGINSVIVSGNTGIQHTPDLSGATFVMWDDALPVSGTFGPTDYVVEASCPTTIYYKGFSEVSEFSKYGKRVTVVVADNMSDVVPGDYVIVDKVHPQIDGARKVISSTYSDGKYTLILDAKSSGILPRSTTHPENEEGYVYSLSYQPINSVTVKFDNTYGIPASGIVQLLTRDGWQAVGSFTDDDITTVTERDLDEDTNIVAVRLFSDGTTLGTTEQSHALDETFSAGAVRVIIQALTQPNAIAAVVEVSGRLSLDVTSDIIDFEIEKELGSSTEYMPVGTASSNIGSLTLSNTDAKYSALNYSSPISDLLLRNAIAHVYMNYGGTRIKLGTMITDEWDTVLRESASVDLVDKSIILQDADCKNTFIYDKSLNITTTMALKSLLGVQGFGNMKFYGKAHGLKAFYSRSDFTVWETIQTFLEPFQSAAYFDEYGRLQIMYRDYIFPEVYRATAVVSGNTAELMPGHNAKPVKGMLVVQDGKWINQGYVSSVSGNTVTIDRVMDTGRYEIRMSSSRSGPNYSIGRNSDIPTHLDSAQILSVGSSNYHAFLLEDNYRPEVDPPSGILQSARRFTKSNEFYITQYNRSGATASAKFYNSVGGAKPPVQGDTMFVSGLGDGLDTDNSVVDVLNGDSLVYSMTGSVEIPQNYDAAGVAGYTSGTVYYRLSNIFAGNEYEFTGYLFREQDNDISIYCDGDTSDTFVASEVGAWQKFAIRFIPSEDAAEIAVDVSDIAYGESFMLVAESISIVTRNNNNVWYDDIYRLSYSNTSTASEVEVSYRSLNPYSERSTNVDGTREIGQNSELWRMEDFILPVFKINSIEGNTFTFGNVAMNVEGAIDAFNDTATAYAWIPYSGSFTIDGDTSRRVYDYESLVALLPEDGNSEYIVSDNEDYVDARNQNGGKPPKWKMEGILKKEYPDVGYGYNESIKVPVVTIGKPSSYGNFSPVFTEPRVSNRPLSIPAQTNTSGVFLESEIANPNTVGAVLTVAPTSYAYSYGVAFNASGDGSSGVLVGIVNGWPTLRITGPGIDRKIWADRRATPPSNLSIQGFPVGGSLPVGLFKVEAQFGFISGVTARKSRVALYVNSILVATFDCDTADLLAVNGSDIGVFVSNTPSEVGAIYWARQPEKYLDGRVVPLTTSGTLTFQEAYELMKKNNPQASEFSLRQLASQYLVTVGGSGASALPQINEYVRRGTPNKYLSFYGYGTDFTPPQPKAWALS